MNLKSRKTLIEENEAKLKRIRLLEGQNRSMEEIWSKKFNALNEKLKEYKSRIENLFQKYEKELKAKDSVIAGFKDDFEKLKQVTESQKQEIEKVNSNFESIRHQIVRFSSFKSDFDKYNQDQKTITTSLINLLESNEEKKEIYENLDGDDLL